MPTRFAPTMRARDVDRVHACTSMDQGLAEGQLNAQEHATRVALAMEAPTLADLHDLVDDLQGETELAAMSAISRPRGVRLGLPLTAVTLVAILAVLVVSVRSCGPAAGSDARATNLLGAASLSAVTSATRDLLGTTTVDQLVVYPEYAILSAPAAGKPLLQARFDYRGGAYDPEPQTTTRTPGTQSIDLATVDWPTIGAILAGTQQSLGLSRVDTMYVIIDGDANGPQVNVQAGNDDGESGSLIVDSAGNFVRVTPFVPEP